jgi:hypothetical protein
MKMRQLTQEQVDQFLQTGHYIMRGKDRNKLGQAMRDWHRLQVEKAVNSVSGEPNKFQKKTMR